MLKSYITKYGDENKQWWAVSWLQLNILGKCFCFNIKRVKL
jgi:hypothetical protein